MLFTLQQRAASAHLKAFATLDPNNLKPSNKGMNLIDGEWVGSQDYKTVICPMTGVDLVSIPDTKELSEVQPFIDSMKNTPRHGLHNPFKNKERYLMLGKVCTKTAEVMHDQEVFDYFV